jgi:hypothetical protein
MDQSKTAAQSHRELTYGQAKQSTCSRLEELQLKKQNFRVTEQTMNLGMKILGRNNSHAPNSVWDLAGAS